ncbi:MAG: 37S ribosomal protein S24, mitochondrial [Bathelium mastoideum]|nr:MAG: 37S ribosomal protein S24, mitochondrial [Bathelium mastoideum]KAI9694747.1 MAG: 37S ribosomal protein S24, mitochondrial [Bathelium mastoideum]
MAAPLKRLRLRAYCCTNISASRCTAPPSSEARWRPNCIRGFSSTTASRFPPPSAKGGGAPIVGENVAPERAPPGFWSMGEESEDLGPDEDFEGDDLTATGHAELDAHRELREFSRIIAWEMPLLSKLAKPFHPPTKAQPLRFRYTTHLHETHPSGSKVVLEFCPTDLPDLTPDQVTKLIKLVGARYNPDTQIIKMACERHGDDSRANKAELLRTLDTLLAEARDPSETFADVPFDFRHAEKRRRRKGEWVQFPEEWKMTEERRRELREGRERRLLEDKEKVEKGRLIDGGEIVQKELEKMTLGQPVMVGAGTANSGADRRRPPRLG